MSTFKQKVFVKEKWLRAFFLVLFGVIGYIVQIIVWLMAIVQFLFLLFSDEVNPQLSEFGKSLSAYLEQLASYLTFVSDEKPFPFGSWPKKKIES